MQNCGRICVVAQTTIIEAIFQEIVNAVQERFPETIVFNTICSATEERQNEAAKIAKDVDKMIVIGDKKVQIQKGWPKYVVCITQTCIK